MATPTLGHLDDIEIGAGLGPLAGQIWRVGFMGSGATTQLVLLFLAALEDALVLQGYVLTPGAGTGAALENARASATP